MTSLHTSPTCPGTLLTSCTSPTASRESMSRCGWRLCAAPTLTLECQSHLANPPRTDHPHLPPPTRIAYRHLQVDCLPRPGAPQTATQSSPSCPHHALPHHPPLHLNRTFATLRISPWSAGTSTSSPRTRISGAAPATSSGPPTAPCARPRHGESAHEQQSLHSSTQHTHTHTLSLPVPRDSWRIMCIRRPRVLFHGIYISSLSYIRQGEEVCSARAERLSSHGKVPTPLFLPHPKGLDGNYRPFHIIEYYRYLRLLPDGTALSFLTASPPEQVSRKHSLSASSQTLLLSVTLQGCAGHARRAALPAPWRRVHRHIPP